MSKLNMEVFADIMNKFIEENHIQMLIDMPEGTQEVTIEDNAELGTAVQYFILLQAMKQVYRELLQVNPMEDNGADFLDTVFEMLKSELLEGADADGQETLSEGLEADSVKCKE